MKRIITKITDSGVTVEEGPAANEVIKSIQWTTKKVVTRPTKSGNWLQRAIRNSAVCEAKRSISEREVRRLQWGI